MIPFFRPRLLLMRLYPPRHFRICCDGHFGAPGLLRLLAPQDRFPFPTPLLAASAFKTVWRLVTGLEPEPSFAITSDLRPRCDQVRTLVARGWRAPPQRERRREKEEEGEEEDLSSSSFLSLPIWSGRVLVCGLRDSFIHLATRQDKEKHFR